jgi:DDE superfamily endonuclease
VSLVHGDCVWINGPYECGKWPDISIFRNSLISHLSEGERVEADDGYIGECPRYTKVPGHMTSDPTTASMQADARKRHETINKRFKQFGILKQAFRSKRLYTHGKIFRAVAIITQLCIEKGEPLFSVDYEDPYDDDLNYFEGNGTIDHHGNPVGEGGIHAETDNEEDSVATSTSL